MKPITIMMVSFVLLSLRSLPVIAHLVDVSVMAPEQPVARLIRFEVKDGYLERFQKVLHDYVIQSILHGSNIMSEAYYDEKDSSVLWLIERWASKDELDLFSEEQIAREVSTLSKAALSKPARTIYIKDLEPISKQAWRRSADSKDSPLTIMLFVNAKHGTEQRFKSVYHLAMPPFRSEPGVITYQLSELEEDRSQFVTFEKFRSNDAFQYHLHFPPIQPVIDYLNTSIKNPPFQDSVHRLIEFAPLTRNNIN